MLSCTFLEDDMIASFLLVGLLASSPQIDDDDD
jgi:hypothetical protein